VPCVSNAIGWLVYNSAGRTVQMNSKLYSLVSLPLCIRSGYIGNFKRIGRFKCFGLFKIPWHLSRIRVRNSVLSN